MKQIEAIKKAKGIAKGYIAFTAIIDMTRNRAGVFKTECRIICVHKDVEINSTISVSGRDFKECLFLLECKVNGTNEEDQDDGN